ncbi:MAG: hypothetical protein K0S32_2211 [Bacteroidetes bacterium]|jgi:hypothetical protein|nr:hypothetical protein [Bacteroidota bacterium]
MKKLYVLVLSTVFGLSVKAQYTVTSAQNPIIGDIEQTWQLDTASLPAGGPGGVSQIWNYTGIALVPSVAVMSNSYVAPSSAPNATVFPAAVNMAQTENGVDYTMAGYTSSGITIYGFSNPSVTAIYQNPLTFATLPFTYGNISTDTYSTSYTFSTTNVSAVGSVTTTGDATGTLNTPGNSFPNVLRIKLENKMVQTINSSFTQTINAVDYVYLNSSSKWSLLSQSSSTVSNNTNTVVVYQKSGKVSNNVLQSVKERDLHANFSIYPNPASEKKINLHYVLTTSENYNLTVYNVLGQIVKEVTIGERAPGLYYDDVDLGTLSSGVYYLKLKGNKQEGTQKLILE